MKAASIIAAGTSLLSAAVGAAEINVISTQATPEAYLELVAQFESASGYKVKTLLNGTLNVQKRLADGERYDRKGAPKPADQVKGKLGQTPSGVFVGPLQGDLQRTTTFSSGIHSGAKERDAAKALVKFLTAAAAAPVIRKHGLEPASPSNL